MQKCEKHNIKLECMGGRNAQRSNWYCPKCDFIAGKKAKLEELIESLKMFIDANDMVAAAACEAQIKAVLEQPYEQNDGEEIGINFKA